jgi:uncharacterized protein YdhG (YjbR/CyaY superfamily)
MAATTKNAGLSDFEKDAARERVHELKRQEKAGADREAGLRDLQAKIAEMPEPDRSLATRVHEIVTKAAPQLDPKTWYGMPAYYRDGKNVLWFKPSSKFKDRYASLGFEQAAQLDDGQMWPIAYALTFELNADDEQRLAELVKRAAA